MACNQGVVSAYFPSRFFQFQPDLGGILGSALVKGKTRDGIKEGHGSIFEFPATLVSQTREKLKSGYGGNSKAGLSVRFKRSWPASDNFNAGIRVQ